MKKTLLFLGIIFLSLSGSAQDEFWEQMADFGGEERHHAIAFSYGMKGYLMTGSASNLKKDFWEYNSLTNTWLQLPDYPGTVRSYGVGCVIGDKAYIGFGHNNNGYPTDWWEYNFTTQQWLQKNNFPGPGRDHPTATALNGKIYMGFGDDDMFNYKDWWEYDPVTDQWAEKNEYPGYTMHHPMSASSESLVYVFGGHVVDFPSQSNYSSKKLYAYDPATDSWNTLADVPGPGFVAGAMFYHDNFIYAGIGIEEPIENFFDYFYKYDIATNSWISIDPYPGSGLFAPVTFSIGNHAYVVTGTGEIDATKDCYRLSFSAVGLEEKEPSLSVVYDFENEQLILSGEFSTINVQLVDISGKLVKEYTKLNPVEMLSVADLKPGSYFLYVDGQTTKFIKR